MSESYWRDKAEPIIRRVLQETAGQPDKDVRAALRAAYPFGPRQYHPYKIWCSEIRRQRLPRPYHGPCACGHGKGSHRGKCHAADCTCERYSAGNPDQLEIGAAQ